MPKVAVLVGSLRMGSYTRMVARALLGAFGANHHLRQSLVFLDMPAMQQPEAYINNAAKLFDEAGQLTEGSAREFFTKFMAAFESWIRKHS